MTKTRLPRKIKQRYNKNQGWLKKKYLKNFASSLTKVKII